MEPIALPRRPERAHIPSPNANPSLTLPTFPTSPTGHNPQGSPLQPHNTRKPLVSLIKNVSWGFVQFVVVITILILTTSHFRSRPDSTLSEWTACKPPLGIWTSIWLVRIILASSIMYWDFRRDRALHPPPNEIDAGVANPTGVLDHISGENGATTTLPILRHNQLHARISRVSSFMTLALISTAHLLEFISTHTCRHSSPHLWWLVFGILCGVYLTDIQTALLGFSLLVLAPIFVIYVLGSVLLICIGRHPTQRINPEISKLPKTAVERIPLVIYIPPPPEGLQSALVGTPHSYPPKSTPTKDRPQPRFKFSGSSRNPTPDIEGPTSWEAHWELGEHPFVTLEGNRAVCAICLMDFEEPKMKEISGEESSVPKRTGHRTVDDDINISSTEEGQGNLKLVDAGDGVQPLRLLACSHVFHKTCLDPWLIDVSGRCPVCQQAVQIPKPSKKKPQRSG